MKKVILCIINILLTFLKFIIIALSTLAAYIDDYLIPPTQMQKDIIIGIGILTAIILDLFVNYAVVKLFNKSENRFNYKKIIIIPCIITLVEIVYILMIA